MQVHRTRGREVAGSNRVGASMRHTGGRCITPSAGRRRPREQRRRPQQVRLGPGFQAEEEEEEAAPPGSTPCMDGLGLDHF